MQGLLSGEMIIHSNTTTKPRSQTIWVQLYGSFSIILQGDKQTNKQRKWSKFATKKLQVQSFGPTTSRIMEKVHFTRYAFWGHLLENGDMTARQLTQNHIPRFILENIVIFSPGLKNI